MKVNNPLSQDFVAHATTGILDSVRAAYTILGDLDACLTTGWRGREEFEAQRTEDLARTLGALGRRLPVLLDAMGMNDTRKEFLASWEAAGSDLGATEMDNDNDGNAPFLVSKHLELIDDIIRVLGDGAKGVLGEDPVEIKTLEYVLRSTPQILRNRGIVPKGEPDIQRALHEHLESTFPDYKRKITLPKGLKNFEPDGAIPSLGVVIEVKYVDTKRKVAQIFSGIMEDLSGYGGSKDWTRGYSVVYQTEPFVNETRFDRSLQLSGNAGSWKHIVVVGPGARRTRSKKNEASSSDKRSDDLVSKIDLTD